MDVVTALLNDGQPYAVQLVELTGTHLPAQEPSGEERLTSATGIRDLPRDGVKELSALLAHIAGQVGRELTTIAAEHRPAEVEAEVCLGLSAQAGPIWLAVKGNYSLRAKLVWKTDAVGQ